MSFEKKVEKAKRLSSFLFGKRWSHQWIWSNFSFHFFRNKLASLVLQGKAMSPRINNVCIIFLVLRCINLNVCLSVPQCAWATTHSPRQGTGKEVHTNLIIGREKREHWVTGDSDKKKLASLLSFSSPLRTILKCPFSIHIDTCTRASFELSI